MAVAVALAAALLQGSSLGTPEFPWLELTGEHFVLRTDLSRVDANSLLRTLEESRQAMLAVIWAGQPGPPGRTVVICPQSPNEVERLTKGSFDGKYLAEAHFSPTIVINGTSADGQWPLAKHELAHHLSNWFLPVAPDWLREGMAGFLETTRSDHAHGRIYVGEPSAQSQHVLQIDGPVPKGRLFEPAPLGAAYARFSATSWGLVHFLIDKRRDAFQRFQHRLGALEPQDSAWTAEFPDLDDRRLGAAVQDYAWSGLRSFDPQNLVPWRERIEARAMAPAEIHAVRAFLQAFVTPDGTPNPARARVELAAALAADVPPLDALALQFYLPPPDGKTASSEIAARAVKAYPKSWLAWLMTADADDVPEGSAAQAATARALALSPDQPEVLMRLAGIKALAGQWAEALALSTRALGLRAAGDSTLTFRLAALAYAGQCRTAAAWSAALRGYLPPDQAKRITATRQQLEWACATAGHSIPSCAKMPAAAAAEAPLFEPTEMPKGPQDYWQRVADHLDRAGNLWYAGELWKLIDPETMLYHAPLNVSVGVTVDDGGRVQQTCLVVPSGIDLVDRTAFIALDHAKTLPVPPPAWLKGHHTFRLRMTFGLNFQ